MPLFVGCVSIAVHFSASCDVVSGITPGEKPTYSVLMHSTCCRCRHAVTAVGSYIFIYGGLKGSTLLDDFLLAEDGGSSQMSICDPRSPTW